MSANPQNVIQGPAILYWAPYGTAEPTDASVTPDGYLAVPPSPWTDVGGTESGISVDVEDTITDQEVNQVIMAVGGRVTKRAVTVTTTLAEATLANLNLALNGSLVIGEEGSYATADMPMTTSATQPNYFSLMCYGWAPLLATGRPALRRMTVRKCLSTPKVTLDYEMAKYATLQVTWKAYYISQNVSPFHSVDALV